jgi:hypothetical protein
MFLEDVRGFLLVLLLCQPVILMGEAVRSGTAWAWTGDTGPRCRPLGILRGGEGEGEIEFWSQIASSDAALPSSPLVSWQVA